MPDAPMIRRQCIGCGAEAERECHVCWDAFCVACGAQHDCEAEMLTGTDTAEVFWPILPTGRTIIEAARRDPQPTLTEENLLRFMREDMAQYGIPPFDPAEFDRQAQQMAKAARVTFGEDWVAQRQAEWEQSRTTLVQQYYARGGRLSAAEQATVDLFDTQATRQFLADFAGDPEQGPSLRRLYPDLKIDAYMRQPRTRHRGWYWDAWRGPRNRRRWAR